jgi:hypothetical protein
VAQGPCPFGPSLSTRFGLLALTTVLEHVRVPPHRDLARRMAQSGSEVSCFAPLARPMLLDVRQQHEGGAVSNAPLGWELDTCPHPHAHQVIKGRVCLCLSSPWLVPSFERTGHSLPRAGSELAHENRAASLLSRTGGGYRYVSRSQRTGQSLSAIAIVMAVEPQ